jgi:hypothetical protein
MQVNSINPNYTNFKSGSNDSDWTMVTAIVPGLNQLINGRTKEGLLFLGGDIALGAAAHFLDKSVKKDVLEGSIGVLGKNNEIKQRSMNALKNKQFGYVLIGAGAVFLGLLSLYDAYKHRKH